MTTLYTVGHSNKTLDDFLLLLKTNNIAAIYDVRSRPYSRHVPHFNKSQIERALAAHGLAYRFMGREIGGQPDDPELYDAQGHVRYDLLSRTPLFQKGLSQLIQDANSQRIALMCGEENPEHCHRHLLIARILLEKGLDVGHIRGDGSLVSASELEAARPKKQEQLSLFGEETAWRSVNPIRHRLDKTLPHE